MLFFQPSRSVTLPALEKVTICSSVFVGARALTVTSATAKDNHLVGHDLGSKVSLAVVVCPTPGLEPTLDVYLLPLGEVLITYLG